MLGKQINLGSPKQLQVVLFDELGMPKTRRTRTGYTTDAEALQALYAKTEHPLLAHLLVHRDAIRLRQTVEGLLKSVADNGRIHTTYVQTIAATGRLSSTDPNLQNIPIRTEEGRRIRQAFVVGAGLRVADERGLLPDRDADHGPRQRRPRSDRGVQVGDGLPHRHRVPGVRGRAGPSDPGSPAKIKAMNYGLAYGLSAFGLSQQLHIETSEAKALMEEYFERFGSMRRTLHSLVAGARRTEYTDHPGRRRYLPNLMSENRQRREMAERMALNAPIGLAANIIKWRSRHLVKALDDAGMRSRCCSRCTTNWSSSRPGGARGAGGSGTGQDGRGGRAERAAGRVRRRRPVLARRRALNPYPSSPLPPTLRSVTARFDRLVGGANLKCRCGLRDFGRSRSRSYRSDCRQLLVEPLRVYGSGQRAHNIIIHPEPYYMTSSLEAPPQVAIDDFGSPEAFLAAIDETIKYFNDGDIVTGIVVKVDRDEVLLDIGYKTEGVIPPKSSPSSTTSTHSTWSASAIRSKPSSSRKRTKKVA